MPRETSRLKFGLQQLYHDIVLEGGRIEFDPGDECDGLGYKGF